MLPENKKRNLATRILFQSVKLPIIYLIIGAVLTALSTIDKIFPITKYKNVFIITDKIGTIFIAFAALVFIYNLGMIFVTQYEKKFDPNHVAVLILSSLRNGFRIIFTLVALNIIITVLNPTEFYSNLANNIINTIIIGSVGWIAVQILYTFEAVLYQYMIRLTREEHLRVQALYTKLHIIRNIATVIIIILTIAAILMSFSSVRNIGISLLASAGFLTAIVGLAAQKTLFSLFSGLQIALAQPIKIGDVVIIENATGTVEEITFTYVTLKLPDRRRLMLPTNFFLEKSFINWSHEFGSLRGSVVFYVDFMMPIEPLRDELDKILKASTFWDCNVKKLQVSNLTDHAVEVNIQVSASDGNTLSDLKAEIYEKMLKFMQEKFADYLPKTHITQHEAETS